MVKKEWKDKGFIDEAIDKSVNLKAEIRRMCEEKGAIILAHYYTRGRFRRLPTLWATLWHWLVRLPRPTQR